MKKYICDICNYSSTRYYDIKRHNQSKKHQKNEKNVSHKNGSSSHERGSVSHKNGNILNKIIKTTKNKEIDCEYCGKKISYKRHLKRHYSKCKYKLTYDEEIEKQQIIEKIKLEKINYQLKCKKLEEKLETELIEKQRIEEDRQRIEEDKQQIEKEKEEILNNFNQCLIKIWEEKTKPQIVNNIQNNTINAEQLTIRYVRKNFTDAYNYDDLMIPDLSNEEIKLIEESPISGCYNLVKNRCVNGIKIDKRPLHLVDKSRNKFAVRMDDQWITNNGDLILKGIDKKISSMINKYDLDNESDRENQMNILKMMLSNKLKILDYLSDDILLKDNAKLLT
jgi:hypothetical protein